MPHGWRVVGGTTVYVGGEGKSCHTHSHYPLSTCTCTPPFPPGAKYTDTLETRTSGGAQVAQWSLMLIQLPATMNISCLLLPHAYIALHYFLYYSLFRFTCHIRVYLLYFPFSFLPLFLSLLSLLHSAGVSIPSAFCSSFYPSPSSYLFVHSTFFRSFYPFRLLQQLLSLAFSAEVSIPFTNCRSFHPSYLLREIHSFRLLQELLFL
jgi:hypothetical protein